MSGKLAGQRCSVLRELTCIPKCFWMSWIVADPVCGVRDILLKSREARVSTRPYCMVAGSHSMV